MKCQVAVNDFARGLLSGRYVGGSVASLRHNTDVTPASVSPVCLSAGRSRTPQDTLATRAFFLLVTLALLTRPGVAHAEPCTRATHLATGQPAPCEGDLVPVPVLTRLLVDGTALALALDKLSVCEDLRAVDADEARELLDAERTARRQCEVSRAPPPARARAWYDSPWVGAVVGGVVVGALAVGLAVAL